MLKNIEQVLEMRHTTNIPLEITVVGVTPGIFTRGECVCFSPGIFTRGECVCDCACGCNGEYVCNYEEKGVLHTLSKFI